MYREYRAIVKASERQRARAPKFDTVLTESGASVKYAANINETKAM